MPLTLRRRFPPASALALALALAFALAMTFTGATLHADDLANKGRDIFAKHHQATVTVQLVLKNKMSVGGVGGSSSESKQEVTGTVIDSSGLIVLSLSATDPAGMFSRMMGGSSGFGETRFKMENELTDIKILTADSTELPAEIVLRDKDLDLAFVRPKQQPASPLPSVDLSQSGTAQILDQVITLNRLGKVSGRSHAASVERITALVKKPRKFYVVGSDPTSTALGSPAFTLEGKLLGVFVMRLIRGGGSGSQSDNLQVIILPAASIEKAAKQAPKPKKN